MKKSDVIVLVFVNIFFSEQQIVLMHSFDLCCEFFIPKLSITVVSENFVKPFSKIFFKNMNILSEGSSLSNAFIKGIQRKLDRVLFSKAI